MCLPFFRFLRLFTRGFFVSVLVHPIPQMQQTAVPGNGRNLPQNSAGQAAKKPNKVTTVCREAVEGPGSLGRWRFFCRRGRAGEYSCVSCLSCLTIGQGLLSRRICVCGGGGGGRVCVHRARLKKKAEKKKTGMEVVVLKRWVRC